MNKFIVFSCVSMQDVQDQDVQEIRNNESLNIDDIIREQLKKDAKESKPYENEYEGTVAALASIADPTFVLFFPIPDDISESINKVINNHDDESIDVSNFGIYKTMVDSWKASEKYLSGIIIGVSHDKEMEEDVMEVKLVLSDFLTGCVDSMVTIDFVNAVLLSVIEKMEIIVTDELLSKLMPVFEDEDAENMEDEEAVQFDLEFSKDKDMLDIVKQIMSGKVRKDGRSKKKTSKKSKSKKTQNPKNSSKK